MKKRRHPHGWAFRIPIEALYMPLPEIRTHPDAAHEITITYRYIIYIKIEDSPD